MDRDRAGDVPLIAWLAQHARPGAAVGYATLDQSSWPVPGCRNGLALGPELPVDDGLLVVADPPRAPADLVRALLDGAGPRRDGSRFPHALVSAVATTWTGGDTPEAVLDRLHDTLLTGATVTDPPGLRRVAVGAVGDVGADGALTVTHVQVPIDLLNGIGSYEQGAAALVRDRAAWLEAVRRGPSQCVAVVDIDRLVMVDGRYGFMVGDEMIVATAVALARTAPPSASIRRTGGDEWLIAWDGDDAVQARAALEAISSAVASTEIARELGAPVGSGTVTAGLTIRHAGTDARTAIETVLDANAAGTCAGGARIVDDL